MILYIIKNSLVITRYTKIKRSLFEQTLPKVFKRCCECIHIFNLKTIRFCMLSLFGRVICCKDISCFETCVILRNITCLNMFIVALNIITDSYHRLINALDEFYCSPIMILTICMSHYNSIDKGMFVLLQ